MSLTKQQILEADDLPREKVPTPEWGKGAFVFVRTLTGTERDAFEQDIIETKGEDVVRNMANLRAKLCVRCMVDDAGGRIFDDADVEALGRKSAAPIDRVFTVAQRLNGLSKKDTAELAKNSEAGAGDGSSISDSPSH